MDGAASPARARATPTGDSLTKSLPGRARAGRFIRYLQTDHVSVVLGWGVKDSGCVCIRPAYRGGPFRMSVGQAPRKWAQSRGFTRMATKFHLHVERHKVFVEWNGYTGYAKRKWIRRNGKWIRVRE